jgi:flagellar basal body-associated protein FliL
MKRWVAAAVAIIAVVLVVGGIVYWRMQAAPHQPGFVSAQEKNAFITSAKQSCIQTELNDPATRQAGYTDSQIALYCQCAAEKAADAITPDEVQYIRANHQIPQSFQQKTAAIAQTCRSVTLPPPAH